MNIHIYTQTRFYVNCRFFVLKSHCGFKRSCHALFGPLYWVLPDTTYSKAWWIIKDVYSTKEAIDGKANDICL